MCEVELEVELEVAFVMCKVELEVGGDFVRLGSDLVLEWWFCQIGFATKLM